MLGMGPNPDRKSARAERGESFRTALREHHARRPPGWQKDLAVATGYTEQQISKIVSGSRPATLEQMVRIAEVLKAPNLLPPELALAAKPRTSPRISTDRGERSDLPATVSAKPVPKDLAEYVAGKGQDERVTVGEFVRLAKASFLEEGKPRSADFWRGILLAIRSE